jgi:hypothetical protein
MSKGNRGLRFAPLVVGGALVLASIGAHPAGAQEAPAGFRLCRERRLLRRTAGQLAPSERRQRDHPCRNLFGEWSQF